MRLETGLKKLFSKRYKLTVLQNKSITLNEITSAKLRNRPIFKQSKTLGVALTVKRKDNAIKYWWHAQAKPQCGQFSFRSILIVFQALSKALRTINIMLIRNNRPCELWMIRTVACSQKNKQGKA